ncbi:MAG: hypothetical protein ACXWC3_19005 [Burkholderiales bacterium]
MKTTWRVFGMIGACTLVLAIGVAVASGKSSSSSAATLSRDLGVSADTLASIEAQAQDFSRGGGEPSPTNVVALASNRRAAVEATGGTVASSEDVVVVALSGHFHLNVPRPDGAPEPTGTELALVFDTDGTLRDVSLRDARGRFSTLGQSFAIQLPS